MPELVVPSVRFGPSFVAAAAEIIAADKSDSFADLAVLPAVGHFPGVSYRLDDLTDPETFAQFVVRIRSMADPATPLPAGIVPATIRWWVDGDEYLGRVAVRHRLTPWLLDYGGHIGYVVRPSARRRGHASAILAAALPIAARLGIDPALITCDDDNVASRRVILAAGGRFEDQRGSRLRHWLPTR